MGWFAAQLLWYLLAAFLVGLLCGYLWWVWGWKKYSNEQVSTSRAEHTSRPGVATGAAADGTAAAGGARMNTLVGSGASVGTKGGTDRDAVRAVDSELTTKLRADLDQCQASRTTLEADLETRSGELASARSELADAQTTLRTSQAELAELRAAREGESSTAVADGQAIKELRAANERLTGELQTAQAALVTAQQAAAAAAKDRELVIDLRDEADGLREQLAAATAAPATMPARLLGDYGQDDLERIEGIGPKIAEALRNAGIASFPRLVATEETELRSALEQAGLRFTPSLPSWRAQAAYLVRGDEAGFQSYTDHLVAGREPGSDKG